MSVYVPQESISFHGSKEDLKALESNSTFEWKEEAGTGSPLRGLRDAARWSIRFFKSTHRLKILRERDSVLPRKERQQMKERREVEISEYTKIADYYELNNKKKCSKCKKVGITNSINSETASISPIPLTIHDHSEMNILENQNGENGDSLSQDLTAKFDNSL